MASAGTAASNGASSGAGGNSATANQAVKKTGGQNWRLGKFQDDDDEGLFGEKPEPEAASFAAVPIAITEVKESKHAARRRKKKGNVVTVCSGAGGEAGDEGQENKEAN